jgi:hypothetical protein
MTRIDESISELMEKIGVGSERKKTEELEMDMDIAADPNYYKDEDGAEYSIGKWKNLGRKKGLNMIEVVDLPLGMSTE